MKNFEVLERALQLPPEERSLIADGLLRSLDVPDPRIDEVWLDEAERRLKAYRENRLTAVDFDEIFPAK